MGRGAWWAAPWGREELDTAERLHLHFSFSSIGEGNGSPLQCSCLETSRDGGAWWAAIYGVAQGRTQQQQQQHEDLQDLLELTPKKDVLFITGDHNAKVGSQEIPGVTGKFGLGVQNEAEQSLTVLPRECSGHRKHPLPTTQEKTLHIGITRWTPPKSD